MTLPAALASAVLLSSCAEIDRLPDVRGFTPVSASIVGNPSRRARRDGAAGGRGCIVRHGRRGRYPPWIGDGFPALRCGRLPAAIGKATMAYPCAPSTTSTPTTCSTIGGHRRIVSLSDALLEAAEPGEDASGFRALLDAARRTGPAKIAPGLAEEDAVTVLGRHRGLTYGRWTDGPADTLSIEFDLEHATKETQEDISFRAVIDRAGKVWSRRIDDTWEAWERRGGELKGWLIGDNDVINQIHVAAEGETSTGLPST